MREITLEPIENQRRRTEERTLQAVFPQAASFNKIDIEHSGDITGIFESLSAEGEIIGYVVRLAPEGYSGKIHLMTGISKTGPKVTGMRVMSHTETPGLGSLATLESFYGKFTNRKLAEFKIVKVYGGGENEIAALTGATITTRAVVKAVNEAIDWFKKFSSGESEK